MKYRKKSVSSDTLKRALLENQDSVDYSCGLNLSDLPNYLLYCDQMFKSLACLDLNTS